MKKGSTKAALWAAMTLLFSTAGGAMEPRIVAGESDQVFLLRADGSLYAWGAQNASNVGQLGLGDTLGRDVPTRVGGDNDWIDVAAGAPFAVGLKRNGTLWSWGYVGSSRIDAYTHTIPAPVPTQRKDAAGLPYDVVESDWLAVGGDTTEAWGLKGNGEGWRWGRGGCDPYDIRDLKTQYGAGLTKVWVVWYGVFARTSSGGLLALGTNNNGRLGINAPGGSVCQFTPVGLPGEAYPPFAKVMATGSPFTLALAEDGSLWSWGLHGPQLGLGVEASGTDKITPQRIGTDSDWIDLLNGGDYHPLALKWDGTLWTWGGVPGEWVKPENFSPAPAGLGTDWVAIGGGSSYAIGRKIDGSLWSWGRATNHGQYGLGNIGLVSVPVPTQIDAAAHIATTRVPSRWDFGGVPAGTRAVKQFLLTNDDASRDLVISVIETRGPFSVSSNCPGVLSPGASCTLKATAAPAVAGVLSGAVAIQTPGVLSGEITIPLRVGVPNLKTAAVVDFGQVPVGSTAIRRMKLTNEGASPVTVAGIAVAPGTPFGVRDSACRTMLQPGASCRYAVTFAPTLPGTNRATLTITSDDGLLPQRNVKLLGTGAPPAM